MIDVSGLQVQVFLQRDGLHVPVEPVQTGPGSGTYTVMTECGELMFVVTNGDAQRRSVIIRLVTQNNGRGIGLLGNEVTIRHGHRMSFPGGVDANRAQFDLVVIYNEVPGLLLKALEGEEISRRLVFHWSLRPGNEDVPSTVVFCPPVE